MAKNCGLLDLEKQFAFYGSYHSNRINIILHMIFVWPIGISLLLILYFTPSLFDFTLFDYNSLVLRLNFGFLLALIYSVIYALLDLKAGALGAFLGFFFWVVTSFVGAWLGFSVTWKVVLVIQVVCWTGQFIGHGVFEKRAPALLDNLIQAFVMAPFFVLLEALQSLFGYEPYPGFHAKVQARIAAEKSEWEDKRQKLVP